MGLAEGRGISEVFWVDCVLRDGCGVVRVRQRTNPLVRPALANKTVVHPPSHKRAPYYVNAVIHDIAALMQDGRWYYEGVRGVEGDE